MAREDFAVRGMMPEMNPYEVQPSYAPVGSDYNLSPEVLAQLANLGVNPYGGGQSPMANPVSSPLAVQGMAEANPAGVLSLAVQGVPAAVKEQARADLAADPSVTIIPGSLDDLSRFGGLGGLDGYEANSSGAPVGMPTSYAFPENYGNPKNKVYQLNVNAEDNIRLKMVDGTTIYEGQGPEAAAKAAAMVQEFGKNFGTGSTWILDKQTAGGDWKQVSQDTVGEKKKTALNSFLDVAAPIAGALLAVVPGLGLLAAPGLLGGAGAGLGLSNAVAGALGAAGGSLLNSGLQNQNSAEAFKKAITAAATTYIGAKVGDLVKGGIAASSTNPTSAVGIRNLNAANLKSGMTQLQSTQQIFQQSLKLDPLMKLGDVTGALATKAATTGLSSAAGDVVIKGLTTGASTAGGVVGGAAAAGLAGAGGLTSGTSGVTNAATNTANNTTAETRSGLDTANDAATNDVQVTGTGTTVDTNVGLEIAGGLGGNGITSAVNPDFVAKPDDAELEIKADKKPVEEPLKPTPVVTPKPAINPDFVAKPEEFVIEGEKGPGSEPTISVPITAPTTNPLAVNPPIEEVVVRAKPKPLPEKPIVPIPVILPNGTLNPDFVKSDITVDNPNGTTEPKPKNPLDLVKDVLPYILPLVGGAAGGSGGSGSSGGNTLSYPSGSQPGTMGSLNSIFTSKLPAATGSAALAVTPRDMGKRDWLRYGFGPEASFFSNVPDRQALAVNPAPAPVTAPVTAPAPAPAIASMPALSEKLNEPTPASVPADGTMLNGNPSIVWNGGVNGGWMQTERGMIQPDETLPTRALARGGRTGGTSYKPRSEFAVHGAGTGRSDDIPAVLSDGEYVMDAETVALLGDGSSKAGAEKLDQLRVNLRRHKGANLAKGRFSVNAKSPEKYLAGGRV